MRIQIIGQMHNNTNTSWQILFYPTYEYVTVQRRRPRRPTDIILNLYTNSSCFHPFDRVSYIYYSYTEMDGTRIIKKSYIRS